MVGFGSTAPTVIAANAELLVALDGIIESFQKKVDSGGRAETSATLGPAVEHWQTWLAAVAALAERRAFPRNACGDSDNRTALWPKFLCPRQDSNLRTRLRRAVLYPLSYGGAMSKLYLTAGRVRTRCEARATRPMPPHISWSASAGAVTGNGCAPRSASICVIYGDLARPGPPAIFAAKLRTTGFVACSAA